MRGEHLAMTVPFILDTRSHDIPRTIAGLVRNLPATCIGLSLRFIGGPSMVRRAEREARKKGIRIIWL
jgi:orotidine-5'-phosphate decarboxylase